MLVLPPPLRCRGQGCSFIRPPAPTCPSVSVRPSVSVGHCVCLRLSLQEAVHTCLSPRASSVPLPVPVGVCSAAEALAVVSVSACLSVCRRLSLESVWAPGSLGLGQAQVVCNSEQCGTCKVPGEACEAKSGQTLLLFFLCFT